MCVLQKTIYKTFFLAAFFMLPAMPNIVLAQVADPLAGNVSSNISNNNSGAVPPPAPGGGVINDGQIPPISSELLVLTPEEQAELSFQNAREQVFDNTLRNTLPLEPDEIREVIERFERTSEAAETPFGDVVPEPQVRIKTISLEPSATPDTIFLAPNHVTSITMLDSTGAPWPVADVSWGGDFEVQTPDQGGHVIRISPLGGFKVGNMSLRLLELPTPVTFKLETRPERVDYRFDARMPVPGPNADIPVIEAPRQTVAGDGSLISILDGVSPEGTSPLRVSGVDGRTSAYRNGDRVFVRTPLKLLSPAWSEQVASADGMTVYVIPDAPVLLLSDRGRMVRASLSSDNTGSALLE